MTRRYNKFEFGFLNNAQDATDIGNQESPNANNLDPDKLALGSLEHSQPATLGSLKDLTQTTMAGRRFFLGDNTALEGYTTYDGTGYFRTIAEYPIGFPGATPAAAGGQTINYEGMLAFDIYLTSTDDGLVMGNSNSSVANREGVLDVQMTSGALEIEYETNSGVTTQTVIASATVDTWYRVVIYMDSYSAQSKNIQCYVDKARTVNVSHTYTPTANLTSARFYVGGSGSKSGAEFRLKDLIYVRGAMKTPSQWDGKDIKTLGIYNRNGSPYHYNVILSSVDGSGIDNLQSVPMLSSGTTRPVTTTASGTTAGPLMVEIGDSGKSVSGPSRAGLQCTSRGLESSVSVDENLDFGSEVFVGMRLFMRNTEITAASTVDWDIFRFEDVAGTPGFRKGLEISLVANTLKFSWEDSTGFAGTLTSVNGTTVTNGNAIAVSVASGEQLFIAIIMTDESTTSKPLYRMRVYVNGVEEINGTTSNKFDLMDNERNVVMPGNTASTGTYTQKIAFDRFFTGNIRSGANVDSLATWEGSEETITRNVDVLLSAPEGDLENNEQGYTATSPTGAFPDTLPAYDFGDVGQVIDKVADGVGPTVPDTLSSEVREFTQIDDDNLQALSGSFTYAPRLEIQSGKAYNGPEVATIVIGEIEYTPSAVATGSRNVLKYRVDGQSGFPMKAYYDRNKDAFPLKHYNLQVVVDSAATFTTTANVTCQVRTARLLDGKYQYRAVAVRATDVEPKVEIQSRPSVTLEVDVNNIDAAGERTANNVPLITVPPCNPGYPDFTDRVDLYRKDPDSEEYVKIFEHKQLNPYQFKDVLLITDLPRVEFLSTEDDESFAKINEAIGNDSGNYSMVFNKDNRIWTVPSDRKDLLLYSRDTDWWGWRRENSFSFNGDIRDVVAIRDISVVSGESTLVVFTSKGIYHIVGSGTESSPYTRVPMFGGDDINNIDAYSGSALPFNGSIFFMAKSTDGKYETGAYGQKVYEYNLQQLIELSGRVKETPILAQNSDELEFVSLIGGDKYILKKLNNNTCLTYHKDARAWVTFTDDGTPTDDWTWESKHFDRSAIQQGTLLDSKAFKIDYEGDVTLTFYVKPYGKTAFVSKPPIELSGSRQFYENLMPANMGVQSYFTLSGTSTAKVYNMWFVS